MVKEVLSELVEVRPGRTLFCRHWIVGEERNQLNTERQPRSTESSHGTTVDQHLVCIHGTVASHDQYLPLLTSLEDETLKLHHQDEDPTQVGIIHCWLYDAVGCGRSPIIKDGSQTAYADEEQVKDLHAFLTNLVMPEMRRGLGSLSTHLPELFLIGHSYGPVWILKWMAFMEETSREMQQQQQVEREASPLSVDPSMQSLLFTPKGVVLMSTGVKSSNLVCGGPILFRYDYIPPLWVLKWIQPTLTRMFLKQGFAQKTHTCQPELIAQAQQSSGHNDMQVVRYYYRSHDWFLDLTGFTNYRGTKFLVLHGRDDEIIPIRIGQIVANQLGTNLVSVEDARHMVHQERPEIVAGNVFRFMSNH
jgi:pimeloyl-ACP methyl ester carboxylesterase